MGAVRSREEETCKKGSCVLKASLQKGKSAQRWARSWNGKTRVFQAEMPAGTMARWKQERGIRAQGSGRTAAGEGEGSTAHTGTGWLLLCQEAEELELCLNRPHNWERKQDMCACFQSHQCVFAGNLQTAASNWLLTETAWHLMLSTVCDTGMLPDWMTPLWRWQKQRPGK